jgi:hypothetical protein
LSSYHHPSHLNSSSALHGHLSSQSYYNPCTGSVVHSNHPSSNSLSGQHVLSSHQPLSSLSSLSGGNNSSGSVRVPSPSSSIPMHRTPSPRSQALAGLVDPPSPPDCGDSGSDSGQGSGPTVIYPWMKKVHINQGELEGQFNIPYLPMALDCMKCMRSLRCCSILSFLHLSNSWLDLRRAWSMIVFHFISSQFLFPFYIFLSRSLDSILIKSRDLQHLVLHLLYHQWM